MKYDVFISYSSEDKKVVEAMSHFLEENRLRCFVAYRDVPKGEDWGPHITKAIKDSKIFIYIHTETSNKSKETTREINLAFKHNCVVFPFRVNDVEYAEDKEYRLSNVNWIDAFPETPENYFGKLYDDIKVHFPQIMKPETDEYIQRKGALIRIGTDLDCRIIHFKEELAIARSGDIAEIRLPKGKHILTFEGLESKEDSYSIKQEITDLDYEYYIEVELLEEHDARKAEQERLEREKREAEEKIRKERERLLSFDVNGVSFKMIKVEGGTFNMGAQKDYPDRINYDSEAYGDESPVHPVTLSDYYIGETEVTQELWQAVMGSNPSCFEGPQKPVEQVSWNGCDDFIKELNRLTGKNFRLPTEAEWEYAARGGNKSNGYKYSGSNTIGDVAWYYENSGDSQLDDVTWPEGLESNNCRTHDVKTKSPNELGIYDMSGNVWEWCSDAWYHYEENEQTNPKFEGSSGSGRVLRGGSWINLARFCRVSNRLNYYPDYRCYYSGFRLVLQ